MHIATASFQDAPPNSLKVSCFLLFTFLGSQSPVPLNRDQLPVIRGTRQQRWCVSPGPDSMAGPALVSGSTH